MTRSIGMPDIFVLMIGTYASGTPCDTIVIIHALLSNGTKDPYRHLRHALRLLEHVLKDVKEVFAGHMLRHDAQGVDVLPRPVHA